MSKFNEVIKVLHLESTDVCQAACPLCAREIDKTFNNHLQNHLSMDDILHLFGADNIATLDKMFMCGNYGDPAAGKHTLDIYRQFRQLNPDITLGMNTNGAINKPSWWNELAGIFSQINDYVVFSIDGLHDTNHIYRKNVNWDKLMENASSYITAGGSAHWDMLVYEHNEHQVDLCQELAKKMGFTWFRAKVSKRPSNLTWLKSPKNWTTPIITQGKIDCLRNKDSSLYISANKKVYPCCWLGFSGDTFDQFESIKSTWNTVQCYPVCKKTCGTYNNLSSFTNQWQREIKLC